MQLALWVGIMPAQQKRKSLGARTTFAAPRQLMISLEQYRVLNSCADFPELFYTPFAELNYNGQVFPRSKGPGCAQYEDDKDWAIRHSGAVVAQQIVELVNSGLLSCCRVSADGWDREPLATTDFNEFTVYLGYSCLTWDHHFDSYGFGPHEFETTEAGRREIEKDEYRLYDRALGWPTD